MLAPFVKGAEKNDALVISKFVESHNIYLRKDHLQFLIDFGYDQTVGLQMFIKYGGDFDFELFKDVYLDDCFDLRLPSACTYFGSSVVGVSYCIDNKSGKIHVFDEGEKCSLVHESINAFLLHCFLLDGKENGGFAESHSCDYDLEFVGKFRLDNKENKINGSTHFSELYENVKNPKVIDEYYLIDDKLVRLFLPSGTIITFSGGILDQL